MDTPLQIVFDGLDSDDAIRAQIEEKTAGLERFYGHIIAGRVIVKRINRRHQLGPVHSLTIELNVPGKKLVVSRDPGDRERHEVYVAPLINDAFHAMARQLEDYARKQRGEIKAHDVPLQGRITGLFPDEGYGFITLADGREIYFHRNSVVGPAFDELERETPVRVVIDREESPIGPQATTVEAIGEMRYIPPSDPVRQRKTT